MAGVSERAFLSALDATVWGNVRQSYARVLKEKAKKKTKPAAQKELVELDKWYQDILPTEINSRSTKFLKHDELVKLMRWKLSRGKFRPRLVDFAASNPSKQVEELTREAYKLADEKKGGQMKKIQKAIESLSKMKGIGPATASAILTAGCPDKVAFMADEPTYMVLSVTSLKYSLSEYMEFTEKITAITNKLQEKDPEAEWTPHTVEKTLWTYRVGNSLGMDLTKKKGTSGSTSELSDIAQNMQRGTKRKREKQS